MMTILTKRAAETRLFTVDFSYGLTCGELLSGTPTVVEVGSSDLTISNITLTVNPTTLAGFCNSFVPADKGVQFLVAGGTAGTDYNLRITAGSDATAAQTMIKTITFRVN